MRLYLDNSFLNRPFDDSTVKLNRVEAEILLLLIVQSVRIGKTQFVNSSVIEFENSLTMANVTKKRILQQSLLTDAFKAILEKMGPEKAARVWQVLTPSSGDYLKIRHKLFAGKGIVELGRGIKKFNR